MIKKIPISILLFVFNFGIYFSQSIYVDENMQSIHSIDFAKKCAEQAFKCIKYEKDSVAMYKVLYKFSFGTIDIQEYNQIKNLLSNSKINTNSNKVLVIKYMDSLRSYSALKENYLLHIKRYDSLNMVESLGNRSEQIKHPPFNFRVYQRNQKKLIKASKKCFKKFEKKFSVSINHVYNIREESIEAYEGLNLIKDRGIFKNKFFKINGQFNLLVLKPDGEYFLSGSHISDKDIKKLIENKDWSSFKSDWKATIDTYKINGLGMFERYNFYYHKKHCF